MWTRLYTTPWPSGDQSTYTRMTLTQSICTPETNFSNTLGFIAIDESVEALSAFLRKMGLQRGSSAFIVEIPTETVVATSHVDMLPLKLDSRGISLLQSVSNPVSSVIKYSCSYLIVLHDGSLSNIPVGKSTLGL